MFPSDNTLLRRVASSGNNYQAVNDPTSLASLHTWKPGELAQGEPSNPQIAA